MAGNKQQKSKLLHLAEIFLQKTDEEHPLTAEQLIKELNNRGIECERKSIYSDISYLMEFGMDIEKNSFAGRGYYLADREYQLAEVRLLMDAVQSASFITPKKTRELIKKIENLTSEHQASELAQQVYIDNRNKQSNEEIYYNIDVIHRAIANGKKITFKYRRRDLTVDGRIDFAVKTFVISPYALLWSDDRYYVIGNNQKYDNLMHLRLDRMKNVEEVNEKSRHFSEVSQYKAFFDVADYANRLFNVYGGETASVEMVCSSDKVEQVMDIFGEDVKWRLRSDGKLSFKFSAAISEGLVSDVLKFGDSMEVVAPIKLRQMVKQRVETLYNMYKD